MAGRKQIGWWVILLVLVVGFQSCKDNSTGIFGDQEQEMSGPAPQITSVTPDSGKFGEQVVIAGSNFGATPGENTVTFNGVEADVIFGSAGELLVEVPKGAGVGPVAVSTGGQTGTGPDFDYLLTITVSTVAGTGTAGFANGDALSAQFSRPVDVAIGPNGDLFVADHQNHRIRQITPEGQVTTLAGSTAGYADGVGTNAQFNGPTGLAISASGDIYVAEYINYRIRKITSAGAVTTVAGDGTSGFLDGVGTNTRFSGPVGLDIDGDGYLYVADTFNNRIRKIDPSTVVTTLAGDGTAGYVDGDGTSARFSSPYDVAVSATGDVYVAGFFNDVIRQITPSGVVSTLAGTNTPGFLDGPAGQAEFDTPIGVATSEDGSIFVADYLNNSIRMISGGEVTTIAGDGTSGFVDGDGAVARFTNPFGITTNSDGSVLYVADDGNDMIRKITLE